MGGLFVAQRVARVQTKGVTKYKFPFSVGALSAARRRDSMRHSGASDSQEDGTVATTVASCQCAQCQQEGDHPDRALHRRMNVLSRAAGRSPTALVCGAGITAHRAGGDRLLAQITGMDEATIRPWPGGTAGGPGRLAGGPGAAARRRTSEGRKKDPRANPGVTGIGGAGDGGRPDERAAMGAEQPAHAERAVEGSGASGESRRRWADCCGTWAMRCT